MYVQLEVQYEIAGSALSLEAVQDETIQPSSGSSTAAFTLGGGLTCILLSTEFQFKSEIPSGFIEMKYQP